MMTELQFDLPKERSSIIKVCGVGGGGSNAVNHMFKEGIKGVNFVICNTDAQALETSPVPNKIQLGPEITQGLGAGSKPEIGRQATEESLDKIEEVLGNTTKMVFVTAGMGGGTGTGGAPVIAAKAREMGMLTVGIVTTPFSFEGRRKLLHAEEGIQALKDAVDTIIIVSNDKIREIYGNLTRSEAFANADNILATAAKSISEIITVPGEINVDFADVEYVMKDGGIAIMGSCTASGEERAIKAVEGALNSPLLNDSNIKGAAKILLNISTSPETQVRIDEISEISDFVQLAAGNETDIIFGTCDDDQLGEKLSVTIIATGFEANQHRAVKNERIVHELTEKPGDHRHKVMDQPAPTEPVTDYNPQPIELFEEPKKEEPIQFNIENAPVNDNESETDPSLQFEIKEKVPSETKRDMPFSFHTHEPKKNDDHSETSDQGNSQHIDRQRKLKDLSYQWNQSGKGGDIENEPAYLRRGVELKDLSNQAADSEISHYSLNERPEIKKDNGYLHRNVD